MVTMSARRDLPNNESVSLLVSSSKHSSVKPKSNQWNEEEEMIHTEQSSIEISQQTEPEDSSKFIRNLRTRESDDNNGGIIKMSKVY